MKISINGERAEVRATHLHGALLELGYEDAAIVTAVNGEFVPASLRPQRTLQPDDRLEVLAPMQGG